MRLRHAPQLAAPGRRPPRSAAALLVTHDEYKSETVVVIFHLGFSPSAALFTTSDKNCARVHAKQQATVTDQHSPHSQMRNGT